MSDNNKTLNWDDFKKLGNPENAPEMPKEPSKTPYPDYASMSVRIYLDRKHGRGGKAGTLIKGLYMKADDLKDLAKKFKQSCGVGGTAKNGEIILQGDHRDKMLNVIKKLGVKDVKKAGG